MDSVSTQQAAEQLNVSHTYVTKLIDDGKFEGVEGSARGYLRIPAAEVERVEDEMRAFRRAALNEMEELTSDLRTKELEAARAKAKRHWVKTA